MIPNVSKQIQNKSHNNLIDEWSKEIISAKYRGSLSI